MNKAQEYTCTVRLQNDSLTVKVQAINTDEAKLKAAAIVARRKAFQNTIIVNQKG